MKRANLLAAVVISVAALAACSPERSLVPGPSDPKESPPAPVSLWMATATEAEPFPLRYDLEALPYSFEALEEAVVNPQPTFTRSAAPEDYRLGLPEVPGPESSASDIESTLAQLAAQLEAGERPESTGGATVRYVRTLADGNLLYHLGKERQPGEPRQILFALQRGAEGWTATRLCQDRVSWVRLYPLKDEGPLLLCDTMAGQGRPHRYLSIYRGTTEILRLDRLETKTDSLELLPSDGSGPPPLRVIHYNDWFGYGRTSDYLMERVTLIWDGERYVTSQKEWLADWAYHFTRFDSLLGRGDLDRAAAELAFAPEGGLAAYLERNAPGLAANAHNWSWPRWNPERTRFYVMAMLEDPKQPPWYWFEFTPSGLISAIGKQNELPPQR